MCGHYPQRCRFEFNFFSNLFFAAVCCYPLVLDPKKQHTKDLLPIQFPLFRVSECAKITQQQSLFSRNMVMASGREKREHNEEAGDLA
jgi:hypothetical protein